MGRGHRGSFAYHAKQGENHRQRVERSKRTIASMKPSIDTHHARSKWSESTAGTEDNQIRIMNKFRKRNLHDCKAVRSALREVLATTDASSLEYVHVQTLERRLRESKRNAQRKLEVVVSHQRQELSFLRQVAASTNLKSGVPSPRAAAAEVILPTIEPHEPPKEENHSQAVKKKKPKRRRRKLKKSKRSRMPYEVPPSSINDVAGESKRSRISETLKAAREEAADNKNDGRIYGMVRGADGSLHRFVDWDSDGDAHE